MLIAHGEDGEEREGEGTVRRVVGGTVGKEIRWGWGDEETGG